MNLRGLHEGHTYDVEQSIARYLIVTGSAEVSEDAEPALVVRGRGREVCLSMVPAIVPDTAPDDEDQSPEPAA